MRAMIWVAAVTAALMALIGGFCGAYSSDTSRELREQVTQMTAVVRSGDGEAAMAEALRLEDAWREKSAMLSLWVNHQDIDDVSVGIQQLKVSVEEGETYFALRYLAELDEALAHLYHRDAFMLRNIL